MDTETVEDVIEGASGGEEWHDGEGTQQTQQKGKAKAGRKKRGRGSADSYLLDQPVMERSTRERKKNSRYEDVEDEGDDEEALNSDQASGKRFSFHKYDRSMDYDLVDGDDLAAGLENEDGSSSHSIFELCKVTQSIGRRRVGSKTSKAAKASDKKSKQQVINPEKILFAAEKSKERLKKREALLNFAKIDSESDEDEAVVVPKAKFSGFRQPKSYPSLWAEASEKSSLPEGMMLCGINGNIDSAQSIEKILAERRQALAKEQSQRKGTANGGGGSSSSSSSSSSSGGGGDNTSMFPLSHDANDGIDVSMVFGNRDDGDMHDDDDDGVIDARDPDDGIASAVAAALGAGGRAGGQTVRVLPFPLQGAIVILKSGKYTGYHGRVMCLNKREQSHGYHVQIIGTKVKTTVTESGFDVVQDASKGSAGLRGFSADLSQKGTYVKIIAGEYAGCIAIILSRNKDKDLVRIRVAPFQQESDDKLITNAYHRIRLKEERFRPATAAEVKKYEEGARKREAEYKEAQRKLKEDLVRKALAGEDVPGAKITEVPFFPEHMHYGVGLVDFKKEEIKIRGSCGEQVVAPGAVVVAPVAAPAAAGVPPLVEPAVAPASAASCVPSPVAPDASTMLAPLAAPEGTAADTPAPAAPSGAAVPQVRKARIYKHPNNTAALEMERLATVSILLGIGVDQAATDDSTNLNKIILANSARCATQKNNMKSTAPSQSQAGGNLTAPSMQMQNGVGIIPASVLTSPVMQSLQDRMDDASGSDGTRKRQKLSLPSLGGAQSLGMMVPLQGHHDPSGASGQGPMLGSVRSLGQLCMPPGVVEALTDNMSGLKRKSSYPDLSLGEPLDMQDLRTAELDKLNEKFHTGISGPDLLLPSATLDVLDVDSSHEDGWGLRYSPDNFRL